MAAVEESREKRPRQRSCATTPATTEPCCTEPSTRVAGGYSTLSATFNIAMVPGGLSGGGGECLFVRVVMSVHSNRQSSEVTRQRKQGTQ